MSWPDLAQDLHTELACLYGTKIAPSEICNKDIPPKDISKIRHTKEKTGKRKDRQKKRQAKEKTYQRKDIQKENLTKEKVQRSYENCMYGDE